jgi:hypothetical protein
VSDKATNHLEDSDKREAVRGLIKNFLEPAGANFVEELVFRFLLTRGDTLGGSMRNVGGFMAQKKLTRAILACLKLAGQKCHWLHADTKHGPNCRKMTQMWSCRFAVSHGKLEKCRERFSTMSPCHW